MRIILTAARSDDIEKIIANARALEERGVTEVEIVVDYSADKKPYLVNDDVMARYNVCRTAAQAIVNSIKEYCGDTLGKGKILMNELLAWERRSLDPNPLTERRRA